MPDLPSLKPSEVVRALERAGFVASRRSGSHAFLVHRETKRVTIVAIHNRELSRPPLMTILKQAGLSVEEFIALL